jgi:hypothetical protein
LEAGAIYPIAEQIDAVLAELVFAREVVERDQNEGECGQSLLPVNYVALSFNLIRYNRIEVVPKRKYMQI